MKQIVAISLLILGSHPYNGALIRAAEDLGTPLTEKEFVAILTKEKKFTQSDKTFTIQCSSIRSDNMFDIEITYSSIDKPDKIIGKRATWIFGKETMYLAVEGGKAYTKSGIIEFAAQEFTFPLPKVRKANEKEKSK